MTGSEDGAFGSDGGDDDEAVDADADLDVVHPVSTVLRSVQHGGSETDASADAAEDQSVGDAPEMDPDGLNEVQPVTTSLRSVQCRTGGGDTDAGDAAEEQSDADGRGDTDD